MAVHIGEVPVLAIVGVLDVLGEIRRGLLQPEGMLIRVGGELHTTGLAFAVGQPGGGPIERPPVGRRDLPEELRVVAAALAAHQHVIA